MRSDGRGRGGGDHDAALYNLDLLLALGDLELGDAGLLDQVDQFLELAQVHRFCVIFPAEGSILL